MAESSSTISEEPPIEKPGLGLLVPDATPSDPVSGDEDIEIHAFENEIDDEKLRNEIEQEIYQLSFEQAEIERPREELEIIEDDDGGGESSYSKMENMGYFDEYGARVEEEDVEGQSKEMKLGGQNHVYSNNPRRVNYPMRPDAEDCAYFMKFGSCKYGLNCKFNHPPNRKNQAQGVKEKVKHREENSERTWQTECKYYLTSGGCKYGTACKFSHGSEKSFMPLKAVDYNFLGLPIRQGEKECPYYMRTGSCKYGSNCRFHHPEPAEPEPEPTNTARSPLPHQLASSSWSSQRPFSETTSRYSPVTAPTPNQEWNNYQPVYNASEGSHGRLPTPSAFTPNNLPTEINYPMQQYHHHRHDMGVEEYPERPGEPECNFFMKTGDCKYKSTCKFHHPRNRITKTNTRNANVNSSAFNDKGLPLRPDQPICTNYHRYGICKYGPACKYDHPSNYPDHPSSHHPSNYSDHPSNYPDHPSNYPDHPSNYPDHPSNYTEVEER